MNLQCPSVARPNNPLGEFFERPLGELLERSTRRAFQTICLASLPNDPTSELPKPFFVLLASTDKSECRDATGEFENAYRSGSIMLARIGPPTSRHRPHCRTVISHADEPPSATPTTLPHFPENFAPVFHVLGKNPTHERNDHERFLEQTRRQTRKRPPQPPSASIVTHKEEPWARNTTEESEPTKGS